MLDSVLSTPHVLFHLIFTTPFELGYYLHFTDEEIEAQRG